MDWLLRYGGIVLMCVLWNVSSCILPIIGLPAWDQPVAVRSIAEPTGDGSFELHSTKQPEQIDTLKMESIHVAFEALVLALVLAAFVIVYIIIKRMLKPKEINLLPFFEKGVVYSPSFMVFRDKTGKILEGSFGVGNSFVDWQEHLIQSKNEFLESGALKNVSEIFRTNELLKYNFSFGQPQRVYEIVSLPVTDNASKRIGVVDIISDITRVHTLSEHLKHNKRDNEFLVRLIEDLLVNLYGTFDFKLLSQKITDWLGCKHVHVWVAESVLEDETRFLPLTKAQPFSLFHNLNDDRQARFGQLIHSSLKSARPVILTEQLTANVHVPFLNDISDSLCVVPLATKNQHPMGMLMLVDMPGTNELSDETVMLLAKLVELYLSISTRNHNESVALAAKKEELSKIENLMDNLPGAIYTCKNNEHWDMVFLSKGIEELTGYMVSDFVTDKTVNYSQITHPEDRARVIKEIEIQVINGERFQLSYRLVTKNGKVKWVWESGRAKGFSDHGEMLLEGLIMDITSQVEADMLANERQEFIKTMVEALPFRINVVGKDGVINNEKLHSGILNVGYTNDRLNGLHVSEILPQPMVPLVMDYLNEVLADGKTIVFESQVLPVEPSRWFESRMVHISPSEALVFSDEITERKQNDAKVAESELLFRSLFDLGNIAMGILEKDLSFSLVNSKLNSLLGNDLETSSVFGWSQIIIPEDFDYDQQVFKQLEMGKLQSYQGEKRLVKSDGAIVYTHFTLFMLKNDYLQSIKYIVSFLDISDRMNLERRVLNTMIDTEEKERVRISRELHDGMGPLLSSIKMYLQWMQMKDSKANKEELVVDAEVLIDQALQTVRDISFNLSPHLLQNYGLVVALESFIKKVRGLCNVHYEFNHSGLTKRLGEEHEVILYRALTECINNTLKYAHAKNVFINFSSGNGMLLVSYRDDGIGFDVNEAMNRKTGMGLFNMQSRLKAVNGKVDFKSERGKGCLIEIQLTI